MMSCIATVGNCGVTIKDSFTNQQINSVICGDTTDSGFLYYVFRTLRHQLLAVGGGGSVYTNVSKSRFSNLKVPLPPISEQRRIAAVLGALDDKIELNRRMNRTLEALAQALFRRQFVTFDGHDRLADSGTDLGEIPEGWQVTTLKDGLSEIETGTRPKGGISRFSSGVPSIGAESITTIGEFDFSKTKYVPEDFFEGMRRGILKQGDVLLYKDGGRPGEFEPHVSMAGEGFPFERAALNSHVYRLRSRLVSQEYLYLWLSSEPMLEQMRRRGTGVAIPSISRRNLYTMPLLVPDQETQSQFDQTCGPLLRKILTNSNQSRTLATLRDTLLPELVSGRVRVPEGAVPAETA